MRSLVGLLFPRPDLTGNAAFVRVALLASAFLALITCAVSPAAAQKPEPSSVSSATAPQQAEAKTETGPTEAEERVALHNTLKEWRAEKNPVKRSELASAIQHTAIRLEEDRMVAELSRNGIPRRSIPLPDKVRDVRLMHVATFPFKTKGRWVNIDAVVRRITRDRIEVWLPTEGWLLDSTGKQLNHVTIKRRDKEGTGREWYGAFLPDGCYITTELWDMDRALYGFSAQGKPMWELKIPDLQPAPKSDSELWRSNNPSIGWARSTRNGLSWIMSLGTEGGYGYVTVTPLGKSSPLPKGATPWTLSYPGALGPRGYYCVQNVPNSKGDRTIHMHVASHGFECGYPDYNVQRRPPPAAGCGMDDESWFN
ncbi:MAG TPA: hypothetical protein VK970_19295, partial [Candidatus Methylacidiphilales bacterium]|nr:hypothetical protein [Candidatus Methylacidiphilales bacterium]